MTNIAKWAGLYTPGEPPSRKARSSCKNHYPSDEWDRRRSRIEELWRDGHTISELRGIMELEGFHASEKQLRNHLKAWGGDPKYLSNEQKRFVIKTVEERSRQQKKTSFRYKRTKIKIPSSKIRRIIVLKQRLRRARDPNTESYLDSCSTTTRLPSSHGISAYTSSTTGIMLRIAAAKRRGAGGSSRTSQTPPPENMVIQGIQELVPDHRSLQEARSMTHCDEGISAPTRTPASMFPPLEPLAIEPDLNVPPARWPPYFEPELQIDQFLLDLSHLSPELPPMPDAATSTVRDWLTDPGMDFHEGFEEPVIVYPPDRCPPDPDPAFQAWLQRQMSLESSSTLITLSDSGLFSAQLWECDISDIINEEHLLDCDVASPV